MTRIKPLTKAEFADWQREIHEQHQREAALVRELMDRLVFSSRTGAAFLMTADEVEILNKQGFYDFLEELEERHNVPPALDRAGEMFTYFIQAGNRGPIKIGRAKDVESRLNSLQTAHHEPLNLLGSIKGSPDNERKLHWHFRRWKLRGEWFRPSRDLTSFIEEHADELR